MHRVFNSYLLGINASNVPAEVPVWMLNCCFLDSHRLQHYPYCIVLDTQRLNFYDALQVSEGGKDTVVDEKSLQGRFMNVPAKAKISTPYYERPIEHRRLLLSSLTIL